MVTLAPSFLIETSIFLQVRRTIINAWMNSNLSQIRSQTEELPALEPLEKNPHILLIGEILWPLATSFLIGSSSFLQAIGPCINAWMRDLTNDCEISCP